MTVDRLLVGLATILAGGCVHRPPEIDGHPSAPESSGVLWTPPPAAVVRDTLTRVTVPTDLGQRVQSLTLRDVIDVALRNNTVTRATWAQARAAADIFGSSRGRYYPSVDLSVPMGRTRNILPSGAGVNERSQAAPLVTISYLLFDFGARSGAAEAAKQNTFAASLTHNSAIQGVVLAAESAYFDYMATRALLAAQEVVVKEATASVTAAEERRGVGLATIADVLQARTALSEAQLALETTRGNLATARGSLAIAMGLPANVPYDIQADSSEMNVLAVSESVDSLIAQAVRNRPDLAAAQAEVRASVASIRVARSAERPSLLLNSNAGRTYNTFGNGSNYAVNLGIQVPIFSGFSKGYDVLAAEAQAEAAAARASGLKQQVINEVFVSYSQLQTAAQRVDRSNDLLTSAQQSEAVARGRYREGVGSILDLLSAQTALANARAQQVQARWQWYNALAQLARDTGRIGVDGQANIRLSPDTSSRPPR
jgi:outer membrane protein